MRLATCVLLVLVSTSQATIIVPEPPKPPVPPPPPSAVMQLDPDTLFIIQSDVPVLVAMSPSNLVSFTTEAGPLKIRGRFVDNPTVVETRTFSSKYLINVLARENGQGELLVWAAGETNPSKVIRRNLSVTVLPQPPPLPPGPPIPVDDFSKALQAAFTADSATAKNKLEARDFLVSVYKSVAEGAVFTDTMKSTADLLVAVKSIIATPGIGLKIDELKAVRQLVSADLAKDFSKPLPLDAATKTAIQAEFKRLADSLGGVR